MGNMGTAGSYGLSLGGLIGGLLLFLVKLLMVALVVAVVIGIFVWVKNNFFQSPNSKFMQAFNKDPILKTISVVTLAIIGIVLLVALLSSFSQPGMGYGRLSGTTLMYSLAGLLAVLVKVLMFVLVVSLILAVAAYLKQQYDTGKLNFFGVGSSQAANAASANSNHQHADTDQ